MNKFPIDALPTDSFIHQYATRMNDITESPIQYHTAAIMSAFSVMLGRKTMYKLGNNRIFPNIYLLVIGESGITRKSSAIRPIINTINSLNSSFVLSSNVSAESLIQNFHACPTRFLFLDEIKMLFDLASKSFGAGIITKFTHLHECPPEIHSEFKKDYDKDGFLKEEAIAENPYLSILGLTTQEWLNVSHSDLTGGFMGRFWVIMSVGEPQKTIPFPIEDAMLMTALRQKLKATHLMNGTFEFDDDTKPLWVAKYTAMMDEVRAHKSDQIASFGSRLGDTLIKLCMIISASMPEPSFLITPEVFESASTITDYLKSSYISMLGELAMSDFERLRQRIIKIMRRHGSHISRSALINALRIKSKDLDEVINDLRQMELLFVHMIQVNGRPRAEYFLTEAFVHTNSGTQIFDKNGLEFALNRVESLSKSE